MFRLTILLLACMGLVFATGCSTPSQSNDLNEKPYFDLSGLIQDQVKLLSILNPTLNKRVVKDSEEEVLETQFDSIGWSLELQPLAGFDINGPRLRDLYETTESVSQDDVRLISYHLKDAEQKGTKYLRLYRDAVLDNLLKIEALNEEGNMLYQSSSVIEMTFHMDDIGDTFLRSYRVTRTQTMLFAEPISYTVEGEISY